MSKLITRVLEAAVILGLVWMLSGCGVVKQGLVFAGEGLKLVGVAANETAKAVSYGADSIQEPE